MKNNVHLRIPTPCHEKWNSFTPTHQGGFCSSCQKEVIDFTSWSEDRLKTYFKNSSAKTCGRFKPEQLKIYTVDNHRSSDRRWFSVLLVSALLLFTSRQAAAQHTKSEQPIEQYEPEPDTLNQPVKSLNEIRVTGLVKDESGEPLPGISILRKGTTLVTLTDADGKFEMILPNPVMEVLVFDFVGFKRREYVVVQDQAVQEIVVEMPSDVALLGEFFVVGAIESVPWYSPKRWWRSVKSLF